MAVFYKNGTVKKVIGTFLMVRKEMDTVSRNFARKWRPHTFDTIVGQELTIRMLKNSLYRNHLFPVYLFSGQRGCGKTTTARIFAAALNCQALELFQKDPKQYTLPCLVCPSCNAMAQGMHADCIEIDAASYTGVDNVRMIIDAASLLPVMGRKKIYIIDEAHMLSKAAFNAFLKILEEPPTSVVFILATTDPDKILETVRSRCFQLFFTALPPLALVTYLQHICQKEGVEYEDLALHTIVQESEGSARDALNILEQVRFGVGSITQEGTLKVLGRMSEHVLLSLWAFIIVGDIIGLLQFLQTIHFEQCSPMSVWNSFSQLIRAALYAKHGVMTLENVQDKERFLKLVQQCSVSMLHFYLEKVYEQELLLTKTVAQHGLLEMLFITLAQKSSTSNVLKTEKIIDQKVLSPEQSEQKIECAVTEKTDEKNEEKNENQTDDELLQWKYFLEKINTLSDPLLISLFTQSKFCSFDADTKKVTITFLHSSPLFQEWLRDTYAVWSDFIKEVWGDDATLQPLFQEKQSTTSVVAIKKRSSDGVVSSGVVRKEVSVDESKKVVREGVQQGTSRTFTKKGVFLDTTAKTKAIDIAQKEQWELTHQLIDVFGGTVEEVVEHEEIA